MKNHKSILNHPVLFHYSLCREKNHLIIDLSVLRNNKMSKRDWSIFFYINIDHRLHTHNNLRYVESVEALGHCKYKALQKLLLK